MPALLAVTWQTRASKIDQAVAEIIHGFQQRGLTCSDDQILRASRVLRFTHEHSKFPDIQISKSNRLLAIAGWCFPRSEPSVDLDLSELAQDSERNVIDRLDGQFSMVCGDGSTLTVACDRPGLFPVYVSQGHGAAWACTSSILLARALGQSFDAMSLNSVWFGTAVRAPRSLFAGVRRLSFGETATLQEDKITVVRDWWPFQDRRHSRVDDAAEEGVELLKTSCRRTVHDYPSICCDLTSGLDTRLLVSGFDAAGLPVRANVSGPANSIDVVLAQQIAASMGWTIHVITSPPNWSELRWPYYEMAASLLEGELTVQRGDMPLYIRDHLKQLGHDATAQGGGGELFREFPWEHVLWKRGTTPQVNLAQYAKYRMFLQNRPPMSLFDADWRSDFVSDQMQIMKNIVDLDPDRMNTEKFDALYLWRQSGHFGRWTGTTFQKLPATAPLMTRDLVEFAFRVPAKLRTAASLIRHMITRASPRVAQLPTCWGGTAEPMGWRHPVRSFPYWRETSKRWSGKLFSLATKRTLYRDPYDPTPDPRPDRDAWLRIEESNMFNIDDWRSLSLYNPDGLRRWVSHAKQTPTPARLREFYSLLTIELLHRLHAGVESQHLLSSLGSPS